MMRPGKRAVRRFYGAALSSYVIALLLVVLVFPGVSNLWVTVFILVSGLFGLLADFFATLEDQ